MVKTGPYRVFVMCYGHKKQPVGRGAFTPLQRNFAALRITNPQQTKPDL